MPARRRTEENQSLVWQPPQGWEQMAPGVWQPPDYRPTRWEVPSPKIYGDKDAEEEYVKCTRPGGMAYFAFSYAWTLDVDDPQGLAVRKVPAYPYLRRFFNTVQEPINIHVEKTRQMIMSWAWMVVFVYDMLFRTRYSGLVLSKRSTDVDDGGINSTPNSNLGKMRFIHDHLPEHLWLPFEFKKFMVRCPQTRSHVKGETGKGGMAARGPTYNRALMDEAAYVDRSETVFKGLRQAAKTGTALNSTANGKQNVFARIRFSNTTTFKKLSFHWSEHPRKAIGLYCICGWKAGAGGGLTPRQQYDAHAAQCPRLAENKKPEMRSPWYDREASDLTEDQVASELDISYEKSQRGRVFWKFDSARNVWAIVDELLGPRSLEETFDAYRLRYLKIVLDPRLQTFVTWDFGVSDYAALILGQIEDDLTPVIRLCDEIQDNQQSYDFYAGIVNTVWHPALRAVGNPYGILHFGDPSGKSRDSSLQSWISNLKLEGIVMQTGGSGEVLEWCDFVNDQFGRGNIIVSDYCDHLLGAIEGYHYPTDEKGEPVPGRPLPVHDESSHMATALMYLYKARWSAKLFDRNKKGVPVKRLLARGSGYDRRTEHKIF